MSDQKPEHSTAFFGALGTPVSVRAAGDDSAAAAALAQRSLACMKAGQFTPIFGAIRWDRVGAQTRGFRFSSPEPGSQYSIASGSPYSPYEQDAHEALIDYMLSIGMVSERPSNGSGYCPPLLSLIALVQPLAANDDAVVSGRATTSELATIDALLESGGLPSRLRTEQALLADASHIARSLPDIPSSEQARRIEDLIALTRHHAAAVALLSAMGCSPWGARSGRNTAAQPRSSASRTRGDIVVIDGCSVSAIGHGITTVKSRGAYASGRICRIALASAVFDGPGRPDLRYLLACRDEGVSLRQPWRLCPGPTLVDVGYSTADHSGLRFVVSAPKDVQHLKQWAKDNLLRV